MALRRVTSALSPQPGPGRDAEDGSGLPFAAMRLSDVREDVWLRNQATQRRKAQLLGGLATVALFCFMGLRGWDQQPAVGSHGMSALTEEVDLHPAILDQPIRGDPALAEMDERDKEDTGDEHVPEIPEQAGDPPMAVELPEVDVEPEAAAPEIPPADPVPEIPKPDPAAIQNLPESDGTKANSTAAAPPVATAVTAPVVNTTSIAPNQDPSKPSLRWELSWGPTTFLLNGSPIQIRSGSVHYFRMLPNTWENVLAKVKASGLNCIETYVPWNYHEPAQSHFRWSGLLDIAEFLRICSRLDIMVILRPGPYICSEWDLGGLPSWLLRYDDMELRSNDLRYIDAATVFLKELSIQIGPFLGDPIVAVQIENEFYSKRDSELVEHPSALLDIMSGLGFDRAAFVMSDNNMKKVPKSILQLGGEEAKARRSPYVLQTANFAESVEKSLELLRAFQPNAPLMSMEYWVGWFDHWGGQHHTRSTEKTINAISTFMRLNASFNVYMMFGGTNFGFMNGAIVETVYEPVTTSYDYDAPIAENAALTGKYHAMRELLKGVENPLPEEPSWMAGQEVGELSVTSSVDIFAILDILADRELVTSENPKSMEALGQSYGWILYTHNLNETFKADGGQLDIQEVHDRAQIFVDDQALPTVMERSRVDLMNRVDIPAGKTTLRVLVENMGRVNYGFPRDLEDRKGMIGAVTLNETRLQGWTHHCLALREDHELLREHDGARFLERTEAAAQIERSPAHASVPRMYFATFEVGVATNTYLEIEGGKGSVWVNGFNIGRFWAARGPQKRLFVPAGILQVGKKNKVAFLQLEPQVAGGDKIALRASPLIDG